MHQNGFIKTQSTLAGQIHKYKTQFSLLAYSLTMHRWTRLSASGNTAGNLRYSVHEHRKWQTHPSLKYFLSRKLSPIRLAPKSTNSNVRTFINRGRCRKFVIFKILILSKFSLLKKKRLKLGHHRYRNRTFRQKTSGLQSLEQVQHKPT